MGLLNLDIKEGFDSLQQKLRSQFAKPVSPGEMRTSLARNDFAQGMEIIELINGSTKGSRSQNERILLVGDMMPHQPFTFGGKQKIIKDYYPGNSEPSVQVLGPREDDVKIKGRIKSKKLKRNDTNLIGPVQFEDEVLRRFAEEMQQLITAMRIRGNVVRVTMGDWQRFGFIESCEFRMKTLADIEYMINFSIIGVNPPRDCKVLPGTKTKPTSINKALIRRMADVQKAAVDPKRDLGVDFDRSLGDQISEAVGIVAEVVSNVTGFVDTVLDEVDDVKSALFRASGLIKHARNTVTTQAQRLGGLFALNNIESSANIPPGAGIRASYTAASQVTTTIAGLFSITALLASLNSQIALLRETEPLARHRVRAGDTLQRLANKFYSDAEQWTEIYDHNKLTSTELEIGSVLEIPRVDSSE